MPVSGVNQFHPPGPLHLFIHDQNVGRTKRVVHTCVNIFSTIIWGKMKYVQAWIQSRTPPKDHYISYHPILQIKHIIFSFETRNFLLYLVRYKHRISTAKKEKAGSRLAFSLIEPNWPLPYLTVPVARLRDARPAGWVTFCSICASTIQCTMPRAQNRTAKGSILLWRRLTLSICA